MNRYHLTLVAAVCCALSLFFLNGDSQQQRENVAVVNVEGASLVTATSEAEKSSQENADTKLTLDEQAASLEADSEEHKLAFELPFPERTNLFQAPKRQKIGRTKSDGQSETSVELLGFVNVDGQRVALSIDGLVTTIAEGGEAFGIEVISIQPPSVFLRRGKQRWQASFEN